MTESAEPASSDTEIGPSTPEHSDSPLRRSLTGSESALLAIVMSPLYAPTKGWPVWDFVSRKFYTDRRESAEDTLAGLPTIQVPGRTYSLVWRSEHNLVSPAPHETVGLTVAGLHALGSAAGEGLARWLVESARSCGRYEASLVSEPFEVANASIDSSIYGHSIEGLPGIPQGLPTDVAWEVFQREPLTPSATRSGSGWTIVVNSVHRELGGLTDVDSYLDLMENQAVSVSLSFTEALTSLTLPASLDYFTLVVQSVMGWGRIARPKHLLPVAQLALEARTREEFGDRVNAVYEVLNSLEVPRVEGTLLANSKWREANQPPPLIRLGLHLSARTDAELVWDAVDDLRAVIRIRAQINHPAADHDTLAAYRRLGVVYPVRDWSSAWNTIRFRTTRAFDSMREALQAEPEAPSGVG